MTDTFELQKAQLTPFGDQIFRDLTSHALISASGRGSLSIEGMKPVTREQWRDPSLLFPATFYVKWAKEYQADGTDDTNGLRFYRTLADDQPFLIMGESDCGFGLAVALMRTLGRQIA